MGRRAARYDGFTLEAIWPIRRPYGPKPWAFDGMDRTDLRPDDYWNRRAP